MAISRMYSFYSYGLENEFTDAWDDDFLYLQGQQYNPDLFSSLLESSKTTGEKVSLKEFAAIMEGDTKVLAKLIAETEHSSKDINAAQVSAADDERAEDAFTPAVSDHSGKHYFTREEVQEIIDGKRDLKDMREVAMFFIDSLFIGAGSAYYIVRETQKNIIFNKFKNT